jgi:hypothetical protein
MLLLSLLATTGMRRPTVRCCQLILTASTNNLHALLLRLLLPTSGMMTSYLLQRA